MKIIQGDLIELAKQGYFDVIVHGCNCFCMMGAGIAKYIKQEFPAAYHVDCQTTTGDRDKLGTISYAQISRNELNLIVVNGYTQYHWHGKDVLVDYAALQSVFRLVKQQFSGKRIGYPKIGAGLARGDWSKIAAIIDQELAGEDHILVEFDR